ncbi:Sodium:dicarboxylate symporter OS=Tsukamurella paurometabola (strain ATCC 8368 / DSM / CCUG 35730 / CIP 100753 / JCM 10117 / KCTC 9821 / NBRC 16120 / NCIMB 702349 / NCTC 13040) OX=521096 GN=Tpau_1660 PE=4 SV=1 [Tsukamurella paurometabola]|uniref:Sodium:dicarboxylate symporter n=1 Tax=Tsukamurella paurometabola (strain ATCC 8368 / DSM 20162 / CCUG 35730 / CIP 100753 / JCM 10117 / KCTC 9821 / NBRC 16120 / NCIMB 702349 / NCTC 13040) TaxID=521096 RepID=D5UYH3_TSUPD|nr:dicarboxylate/amino acid:cation symporter [Tsukamurella paurometabola]ADG78280.1 sodium:dicarboxylate symporter [Tsukamurella paurometabola DSM 20162]SUP31010.1 Glutamate-aspartate carrier protein [Tsukamurella paurometabola]
MSTAATPATAPSRIPPLMKNFGFQITLGLIVGVLLGLLARRLGPAADGNENWLAGTLDTIGSSYVKLLTVAVVPLVVTAVVASIANLRNVTNAARLAAKTLVWFAITAFIAVVIGIILGLVLQPGEHTTVTGEGKAPSSSGSWWAFLTGLVPSNFLGLQAKLSNGSVSLSFNVLQVLVIAIAIGIAALKVGQKAEPFLQFNASLLAIVQKVLWWIIRLSPIGTAALIGNAVATYGWSSIGSLGAFTGAIYLGLVIVGFVVYPILVRVHGLSVRQFYSGVWPAAQLGFVSRSSIGTLPVTERVTERNLGVPREYASFAVPLGATTKMDGCAAIYPAIAAIFVAQYFHIDLQFTDYLLIVVVAVIGSAATAGTTGATVMLTLTLSTLGLPLAGAGLLLAVEPIVDMGRTALNVTGQALVPTLVAKQEGILDEDAYNAPRTDVYADESTDAEPVTAA